MANKVLEAVIKARDEASAVFQNVGKAAGEAGKAGTDGLKGQNAEAAKADGWLARLAQRSKELRREQRASGEKALGKLITSPEGMSQAVFQQLGIGLQAMVIDKIGQSFANIGNKIVEVQKGLREGTDDWRSTINKTAQEIPMLGGFVKGFNAIRESITGEQHDIDITIKQTELLNRTTDHRIERAKALKAVLKEIAKEGRFLTLDLNIIGKDGFDRTRAEFEKKQVADRETFEEGQQARVKEEQDAFEKRRRELQDKISEEQAKGVQARNPGVLEDLKTQLSAEEARHARDKKRIEEANAGNATSFARKQDKEAEEFRSQNNAATLKMVQEYQKQARRLNEEGMFQQTKDIRANMVLRLQAMGEGLAAELLQMQTATEAEKALLERRAAMEAEDIREQAKRAAENAATPERKKEILDAAENRIRASQANVKTRNDELDKSFELNATARIKNALDESNLRILQMQAAAGDARAKVEAETVARLNEELKLRNDLKKILATGDPGEKKAASDRLKALDEAGQKRSARQVENLELAGQELQSQVGATASERLEASQKAARTRLMREFEDRKAEVEALLGDKNATDEQKAKAKQALELYANMQGRAFDRAIGSRAVPEKATADTQESPYITGLELRAQQRVDAQKELLDVTKAGLDVQKAMLDALKNIKPAELKATVGVPYGSR